MYDDQRRWDLTLNAAWEIRSGESPQRALLPLAEAFAARVPADVPGYAVGQLLTALLAHFEADTRRQLRRLSGDEDDLPSMPRRKAIR